MERQTTEAFMEALSQMLRHPVHTQSHEHTTYDETNIQTQSIDP